MPGIAGRLIGLSANGDFFACETSSEFNCTADMLPATSPLSGRWKEFIPGNRTWTMAVNQKLLLESVQDAKSMLHVIFSGLPVYLQFRTKMGVEPEMIIYGSAYPQSVNFSAPGQGAATTQISFQGTGPVNTNFEDYDLIIDQMPPEADWPIIVDTNIL